MQDPKKLDAFDDYLKYPGKVRDMRINEFTFFVKDDWKVMKSLTLNLGMRYDYYGVPYETSGLMPLPVGGGSAAFGISGRSFDEWMSPGARADATVIQYVGKNSPNPGIGWHQDDWNNVGPAVGFAWQVPWFGEGKTTVRGGYQMTYQIGDGYSSMVQETNAPGSTNNVLYTGDSSANAYLDLAKLPVVDSGAQSSQANAARSPDGEKPADLYSGSEPCDSLRAKPDDFGHAKRRVESIGGPALRRYSGQKATQCGKQHQCAQLPEQRIEGSLRRGAERR